MPEASAADNLQDLRLDSGWTVVEKLEKTPGATGMFFSVCYKVTKDDRIAFLKAFNFARFFDLSEADGENKSIVDVLTDMLAAYRYERDLSLMCKDSRVTKVAFVIDSGEQRVPGFSVTLVPYLVFDLADGDVRSRLSFSTRLESAWKLNSLHSVAVGLKQLHGIDVSHQDLKPSNILVFSDESKIGDLGRSTCRLISSPFGQRPFTGAWSYAPPEILYGSWDRNWKHRSFGADLYMFGSLIVFYFSGSTMNALLRRHIPDSVSWEQYRGQYDDVKAYVMTAFSTALDDFEACVPENYLAGELRSLVQYLCNPIPEVRGHPRTASLADQHSMERFISRLDLLHRRAKYGLMHSYGKHI